MADAKYEGVELDSNFNSWEGAMNACSKTKHQ